MHYYYMMNNIYMGSNYFGEAKMENERGNGSSSSSSSSSSRKGKKNIEKKKPKRGLGVAELEKIRIHDQMVATTYNHNNEDLIVQTPYSSIPSSYTSYSASVGFQSNFVICMEVSEYERTNLKYGDSHQPINTARLEHAILESQSYSDQPTTRPLLNLHDMHQHGETKKHGSGGSVGSSNQNSETSDTKEPDLELRLSL